MSEDDAEAESRSDRLRRRRSQRGEQASESSGSSESSETVESDETSNVKSEREGVYMYLTGEQKKEVERMYSILKADYEYEYDVAFEKNRHFYPLLIQHGLEGLEGLDASEIRERLDSI
jgi:hypothetical protein